MTPLECSALIPACRWGAQATCLSAARMQSQSLTLSARIRACTPTSLMSAQCRMLMPHTGQGCHREKPHSDLTMAVTTGSLSASTTSMPKSACHALALLQLRLPLGLAAHSWPLQPSRPSGAAALQGPCSTRNRHATDSGCWTSSIAAALRLAHFPLIMTPPGSGAWPSQRD